MEQKRNRPSGIKYKKEPSNRQKKVLAMALKNHGKMQPAMEAAGYNKQTAKNPKNVTNSKSWAELLDQVLSDDILIEVTKDGLQAVKPSGNKEMQPDYAVRHRYLETALKIKGKLITKNNDASDGGKVVGIEFVMPDGTPIDELIKYNAMGLKTTTSSRDEDKDP